MFPSGKPGKNKFAKQLIAAIKDATGMEFEYDRDNFQLVMPGDDAVQLNLANIYQEHCNLDKEDRPTHLESIASIFDAKNQGLPDNFEDIKSNLRPKLWNRSTFEFAAIRAKIDGTSGPDIPLYPVGEHLYSSLVYDTEHSMRSISNSDLENWGVSYYEAMEHAVQNLDQTTVAWSKIGDTFYSSMSGDNYDSARLLVVDRIRTFEVVGDYVGMAPQRDALHVAGSDDPGSLEMMFTLSQQKDEQDVRPLSPLTLVLKDGHWEDWAPPANHIVRPAYDQQQLYFLGALYTQQKELLEELHIVQQFDVFVASFSTLQNPDDETLRSFCVWGKDIDSLLPKTQLIMFVDQPQASPSVVLWEEAQRVVGDLMKPDDNYPTRYRVSEYPSAAQIAEMAKLEM